MKNVMEWNSIKELVKGTHDNINATNIQMRIYKVSEKYAWLHRQIKFCSVENVPRVNGW